MTAGGTTETTQVEPFTARQEQLLTAAVQVVGESGLRGLTHRAVDRQAEVPEGTCSVSFRTRLALLTALSRYVAGNLSDQIEAMGAVLPEPDEEAGADPAIDAAVELLSGWLRFPAGLICMAELGLEMIRTPSLRTAFQPWRAHMVDVVQGIVERGHKTQPRMRAEAIVASLEGVLISALVQEHAVRDDYLRETLMLVVHGLADMELPEH
ncbi:TetR/AcrR family transcriptional regulator [Luteipulveratus halotolerans]|uniref:TetR/AcrR family transcriptional regulator n=1 Tax=Luteipulveratus halotolerans TaxID=1631356 RepID=UPI000681420C|nr:TetR/AcrR family transcriptional regulator [Luteipulveratus halotolerans]